MRQSIRRKPILSIAAVVVASALTLYGLAKGTGERSLLDDEEPMRSLVKVHIEKKPLPTTFLLGIFSYSAGENRRKYIRETYLSIEDERICKLDEFIRQTKENPLTRKCMVPYTFVMGGGGYDRPKDHNDFEPLTKDTDKMGNADPDGDCTYLNIKENMEDGKSPSFLKWAANLATEYGIDYIGKLDDDSFLQPKLLFRLLEEDLPPAPYNTRIYGGATRLSRTQAHMYAAGEFYFVSNDLAQYVGNELTAEDREVLRMKHHIEDLDMGTFIYSHPRPIKYFNLAGYKIYAHPLKSEKKFRDYWKNHIGELPRYGHKVSWMNFCKPVLGGIGY